MELEFKNNFVPMYPTIINEIKKYHEVIKMNYYLVNLTDQGSDFFILKHQKLMSYHSYNSWGFRNLKSLTLSS